MDELCKRALYWRAVVRGPSTSKYLQRVLLVFSTYLTFQSNLRNKDGKIVALLIYADKSKLSSFVTAKAYPVVMRVLNIHSTVRNGKGVGAGRVVGWLPVVRLWQLRCQMGELIRNIFQVEGGADEEGLKGFVDFKRVVWHESFRSMLNEIAIYSQGGYSFKCGDGETRLLFPRILILSGDYEEQ